MNATTWFAGYADKVKGLVAAAICAVFSVLIATASTLVPAAPFVYVVQRLNGTVGVIDAATNMLTTTIPVGSNPSGIVVNRSATKAYVANSGSDTISIVDLAKNLVVSTVAVDHFPIAVALDPADARLYVASGDANTITVLEASTGAFVKRISLVGPDYYRPIGLAVDPSGTKVYVLLDIASTISIIDVATGATSSTLDNRFDLLPLSLTLEPTGRKLYVVNGATRSVFDPPPGSSIVTVIDTNGTTPVASIDLGDQDEGIALSPQQGRAYVATQSSVKFIDTANQSIVASVPVANGVKGSVLGLVGNRLYVSNFDANTVIVIDVETKSVIATIPVPGGPSHIATTPPPPANYQGLWWAPNGAESGWGVNLAHQGDTVFATWFTYGGDGKGIWMAMTAQKSASDTYSGTVHGTTGPPFNANPFDPAKVQTGPPGAGTLTFSDGNRGTLDVAFPPCPFGCPTLKQTKSITRQPFGPIPTCVFGAQPDLPLATNYTDMWWAAPAGSESGWGLSLSHQGETIFAVWFTYDLDGQSMWLVATAPKTGPGRYAGTLYRTTGPAVFLVPFDPAKVLAMQVGSISLTFADGNNATFAYTVQLTGMSAPVTQSKAITREIFTALGTSCQ